MALIKRLLGRAETVAALGETAGDLVEVFHPNATRRMELAHDAQVAAQDAFAAEFVHGGATWFDRAVNGLNRLPRPALALGTLGLFAFAMVEPDGFARRMQGLAQVPDPLWWLLGAIVSFYFGARELHYRRAGQVGSAAIGLADRLRRGRPAAAPADNPALRDWQQARGR
ncbi:MAG TPA: methionine synthase I [Rhodobacteraceae bacterium]|jgi:hypothetical protein|nr:holin family protein [Paracoccaceae bacterium]HBG99330.1 methionine synthase I [Paracoccaceae bacterium]